MQKLKSLFKHLTLTALMALLCFSTYGATFNVSNTSELKNALNSASAGDLILLAPGTYTTSSVAASFPTADGDSVFRRFYFRGVNDGTASNKITMRSANSSNPATLSGEGFDESGYVLYITGDHWVVENIKIKSGTKGLMLDNSNNTTIRKVEIFDIGQEGIHVRDGSSGTVIDDVDLHDLGKRNDGFGEGIYVGSDNSVWWEGDGTNTGEKGKYYRRACNNTTIKNSKIGPNITAEPFDIREGTENTIVENCEIYGSGISGENFADSHIDLKGNNARIRCNTFFQNNNSNIERAIMVVPRISAGVAASLTARNNYIHNNIFNLDDSDVDVAVANNGSQDNFAWENTRNPSSGNFYNSRITLSIPSGYSESCGDAPMVCNVPGGLSTSSISQNSAQLNWNSATGAASYDVQWRISGGSWTSVSSISGTNYNLTGLTAGTNYQWRVRSDCSFENSSYSDSNNFATQSDGGSSGGSVVIRAKGDEGSERIRLIASGTVIETWELSTGYQNYSADASGVLRVEFFNDNGSRDVQVDKITVDGIDYEAEDQEVNTGVWQGMCGGSFSERIHCNGYIEFDITGGGDGDGDDDGGGDTTCGGGNLSGIKTIEICNISPNQNFSAGSSTPIVVNYSSDIDEVKYWYRTSSSAWKWIGKASSAPFDVNWNSIPSSAIAFRARGGTDNGNTSVFEVPISVSSGLAIRPGSSEIDLDAIAEQGVKLFPNPVNKGSDFTIQVRNIGQERIDIFDAQGLRIKSISPGEGREEVLVNTEEMRSGIYFVRVGDRVEKIYIQN